MLVQNAFSQDHVLNGLRARQRLALCKVPCLDLQVLRQALLVQCQVALEFGDQIDLAQHGIRVWGDIGAYLKISDNRISVGRIGIAVQPVLEFESTRNLLWVASDNLVENVPSNNVIRAPEFLLRRDNRP